MRERAAEVRRDAGCARAVVDGGVDVCVVEERVAGLRDAREEARVGVEARIEEESGGGAEGPCEARFEGRVRVVVD